MYRGTNRPTEINTFEETGHLLSDAAQRGYQETGSLGEAYKYAGDVHGQWVDIWGNEAQYVEAHGEFGTEMPREFGLPRSFMSVTDDPAVAATFAKDGGVVFGGLVPESMLLKQTIGTSGESEYLMRLGTDLLKPLPPLPRHP